MNYKIFKALNMNIAIQYHSVSSVQNSTEIAKSINNDFQRIVFVFMIRK